jgi:hypothetical protein
VRGRGPRASFRRIRASARKGLDGAGIGAQHEGPETTATLVEAPMATPARTRELEAVRRRRAELRETLDALERSLAAPGADRAMVWGEHLRTAVDRLASEFALHVEVTEGPDGLHQAILAGDLRLANQVRALAAEHGEIAAEIAALAALSEAPVTAADLPDVRERGTSLLGRIVRHRQRGADLIYEAYQTDIGGGD